MEQDDAYYAAMLARDHRFDGKFFVGVKTTGIYCRPICPARPKRENVEFFHSHFEAERAGYRPCLRCRPESAPRSPAWVGTSAIVQRAVKVLGTQDALDFEEDKFAAKFGVSARHLRRLFENEIGKTPKQLAFENRLNLARNLITETALPISEVAFASGFASVRRFNDAFKDRFKKAPSSIRRDKVVASSGVTVRIAYRPPFDFAGLMAVYKNHRVGRLEWFEGEVMHRVVERQGYVGVVKIANDADSASLRVTIDFPDTTAIHGILAKVRSLFDLDLDPLLVANGLERDRDLKKLWARYPGIRLASGWDAFEVVVSAVLGQLVSVERGRALVNDLIELAGKTSTYLVDGKPVKLFPSPADVLSADLSSLKTTGRRRQTLIDLAKAIHGGELSLEPTQDVEAFKKQILDIKGVGPWTAQYIALRALRDTDAFPASDLILARALVKHPKLKLEQMRPWRGYAAALLWRAHGETPYTAQAKPQRNKK